MVKTPQIAEEQLVITIEKAKDTKVSVSVFSADISKIEDISRWRLIDQSLHYDFSANEPFFKNHHNYLSERLTFYPAMGSTKSETKHSPRLRGNTQTHTQTDCYSPPPTLELKIVTVWATGCN